MTNRTSGVFALPLLDMKRGRLDRVECRLLQQSHDMGIVVSALSVRGLQHIFKLNVA